MSSKNSPNCKSSCKVFAADVLTLEPAKEIEGLMWEVTAECNIKVEGGEKRQGDSRRGMRRLRRAKENVEVCSLSLSFFLFPYCVAHKGSPGKTQLIHRVIPQQPSQSSHSLPRGDLGLGKGNETDLTEFLESMNSI